MLESDARGPKATTGMDKAVWSAEGVGQDSERSERGNYKEAEQHAAQKTKQSQCAV